MLIKTILFTCTIVLTQQQDQTTVRDIQVIGSVRPSGTTPHNRPPVGHKQIRTSLKSLVKLSQTVDKHSYQKLSAEDEWDKQLSKDLASLITKSKQPYSTYLHLWHLEKAKEKRKSSTYDEEKVHFFHFVTKTNNEMERRIATKIGLPAEAAARSSPGPGASSSPLSIQGSGQAPQNQGSNASQVIVQQPTPNTGAAQIASVAVSKADLAPAQATSLPSSGIVEAVSAAAPEGRLKRDVDDWLPPIALNHTFVPRYMVGPEFSVPPPNPNAPQDIPKSNPRPMGK